MTSLNAHRGSKASLPNLTKPAPNKIPTTTKAGTNERISARSKLNPGPKLYSSKLAAQEPEKPKNLVPETAPGGPKDEKYSKQMHKRISIDKLNELNGQLEEKDGQISDLQRDVRFTKKQNDHYRNLIDNLTEELETSLAQNKTQSQALQKKDSLILQFESTLLASRRSHENFLSDCQGFMDVITCSLSG